MAAMAKDGFKPFVAIYSTFLQRAYDQIIHDTCLMNLPVTFCIDRAGLVGNDGETHQGQFDVSFLRVLPNMTLLAPRDNNTLKYALEFAKDHNGPCAVRYPRGAFKDLPYPSTQYTLGQSEILKHGNSGIAFIGFGAGVSRAIDTELLSEHDITIVDLKFIKPLDKELLLDLSRDCEKWYIFSDSQKQGGVASAILEFLNEHNINIELTSFEYEDIYVQHGDTKEIEKSLGLLPEQLVQVVDNDNK
jgi:1-deoxy-D-xylulose-5-phosphate synthase